jgi:transcriptional regulator NrdR family protein
MTGKIKMKIKVIKKNGSIEDFETEKIARVTEAAGLSFIEAEKITQKITNWAKNQKRKKIRSTEIRGKVVEEMVKVNEYAAKLFVWYKKNESYLDGTNSS